MTGLAVRIARIVIAAAAVGSLAGCVSAPPADAFVEPTFTQYTLDSVEAGSELPSQGFPRATLTDDGKAVSVRQVGSPGCEIEPVSFLREDGGSTLRVTYEFVDPNPDGVCNTALAYFGTDIFLDNDSLQNLRSVILVGPFRGETAASVGSV